MHILVCARAVGAFVLHFPITGFHFHCYFFIVTEFSSGFYMLSITLSLSFCMMQLLLSVLYCLFKLPELLFYFAFIFTIFDA